MTTAPTPSGRSAVWTVMAGAFAAALFIALWWVSRDPQLTRDILHGLVSIVTTPFFMETTIFFVGLAMVVVWNSWRLKKEGDGWVYLAEDEPRRQSGQLPDRHDAVFVSVPENAPADLDFEIIEGLLDLGSWKEAGELCIALPRADRESPRGLQCRWRLAVGLGHHDQAEALQTRIRQGV